MSENKIAQMVVNKIKKMYQKGRIGIRANYIQSPYKQTMVGGVRSAKAKPKLKIIRSIIRSSKKFNHRTPKVIKIVYPKRNKRFGQLNKNKQIRNYLNQVLKSGSRKSYAQQLRQIL